MNNIFLDYLAAVYPGETITGTQLTEVRRAFYAGAWAVFSQTSPDDLTVTTRELVRDCLQFNEDVKSGVC